MFIVILTIFSGLFYLGTYALILKSLSVYLHQSQTISEPFVFLLLALASFVTFLLLLVQITLLKVYLRKAKTRKVEVGLTEGIETNQIVYKVAKGFLSGFMANSKF